MSKQKNSAEKNLGEFEVLVLAALIRLGPDAYGVTIRNEIETRAGRAVAIGALYTTLSRLEDKGYVRSETGEATAERGGRAKRYYHIEPLGRQRLERSLASLNAMVKGLFAFPQMREEPEQQ
jgi:DNA-binding PadR family transcriptional regulator